MPVEKMCVNNSTLKAHWVIDLKCPAVVCSFFPLQTAHPLHSLKVVNYEIRQRVVCVCILTNHLHNPCMQRLPILNKEPVLAPWCICSYLWPHTYTHSAARLTCISILFHFAEIAFRAPQLQLCLRAWPAIGCVDIFDSIVVYIVGAAVTQWRKANKASNIHW